MEMETKQNANSITEIQSLEVEERLLVEEIKSLELKLSNVRSKLDVLRNIKQLRKIVREK